MINNKQDAEIIKTAVTGTISALIVAALSGFLWAIPAKVVWNLLLVQWLPAISYWETFCIVLVFKLITSPIKRG